MTSAVEPMFGIKMVALPKVAQMLRSKLRDTSRYLLGWSVASCLCASLFACGQSNSTELLATEASTIIGGSWAKQLILTSDSAAAGIRSTSKIERLILVQATQTGTTLNTTEQICDVNATGSKSSSLKFPEALKRVIPPVRRTYEISQNGDQVALKSAPLTEILGAQLNDPERDSLPKEASDARVIDQDGDGQPGVTVEVSARALLVKVSGRVYFAQRTTSQEIGKAVSSDRIEGTVDWSTEQRILGSDSTILSAVTPSITPLVDRSTFIMRKVSDNTSCADLIATHDQLFGPLAP